MLYKNHSCLPACRAGPDVLLLQVADRTGVDVGAGGAGGVGGVGVGNGAPQGGGVRAAIGGVWRHARCHQRRARGRPVRPEQD